MGCGGDDVRVRERRRYHSGRDEPADVRHVGQQPSTGGVGHLFHAGVVDVARVRACARNDKLQKKTKTKTKKRGATDANCGGLGMGWAEGEERCRTRYAISVISKTRFPGGKKLPLFAILPPIAHRYAECTGHMLTVLLSVSVRLHKNKNKRLDSIFYFRYDVRRSSETQRDYR